MGSIKPDDGPCSKIEGPIRRPPVDQATGESGVKHVPAPGGVNRLHRIGRPPKRVNYQLTQNQSRILEQYLKVERIF